MDADEIVVIDDPEYEQMVLDLAEEWSVTNEEVLIRVLREALEARGVTHTAPDIGDETRP